MFLRVGVQQSSYSLPKAIRNVQGSDGISSKLSDQMRSFVKNWGKKIHLNLRIFAASHQLNMSRSAITFEQPFLKYSITRN